MTVAELIARLQQLPPDTVVRATGEVIRLETMDVYGAPT